MEFIIKKLWMICDNQNNEVVAEDLNFFTAKANTAQLNADHPSKDKRYKRFLYCEELRPVVDEE